MQIIQNRRRFLAGAAAAGAAGYRRAPSASAEPPPETTTVRLPRWIGGSYCWAGAYIAGELMRADGFTDVQYVEGDQKRRPIGVDRTRSDGFLGQLSARRRSRRSMPACRSRCLPGCTRDASN